MSYQLIPLDIWRLLLTMSDQKTIKSLVLVSKSLSSLIPWVLDDLFLKVDFMILNKYIKPVDIDKEYVRALSYQAVLEMVRSGTRYATVKLYKRDDLGQDFMDALESNTSLSSRLSTHNIAKYASSINIPIYEMPLKYYQAWMSNACRRHTLYSKKALEYYEELINPVPGTVPSYNFDIALSHTYSFEQLLKLLERGLIRPSYIYHHPNTPFRYIINEIKKGVPGYVGHRLCYKKEPITEDEVIELSSLVKWELFLINSLGLSDEFILKKLRGRKTFMPLVNLEECGSCSNIPLKTFIEEYLEPFYIWHGKSLKKFFTQRELSVMDVEYLWSIRNMQYDDFKKGLVTYIPRNKSLTYQDLLRLGETFGIEWELSSLVINPNIKLSELLDYHKLLS